MKMKQKMLSLLSALAVPLLLSGCVNQSRAERLLEKALEEKYGEEFIVKESIVGNVTWDKAGPLYAVCCPESNENLYFETASSMETGGIYRDEYIQAIVREEAYAEMEKILSEQYKNFFLDVHVAPLSGEFKFSEDYIEFESVDDVSILKYEELYGEKMILSFDIVFNVEEITKYEEVEQIFRQYSEKFTNGRVNYFCYYSLPDVIAECNKLKNEKKHKYESFILSSEMNTRKQYPRYRYCFGDGKYSLYEIQDTDGIKQFDENGNEIIESGE